MRKLAPYIPVVSFVALALAACLVWKCGRGVSGAEALVVWGRGRLTQSEQAYHADRVNRVIHAWQAMGFEAASAAERDPNQPYEICLVIDTARPALWIEDAGQVLEDHCVELPQHTSWQVQRLDANGVKDLAQTVRLKYAGTEAARLRPEFILFQGRSPSGEYFGFHFNCTFSSGGSFGRGVYDFAQTVPALRQDVDYYDSLVTKRDQNGPAPPSWRRRNARPAAGQTLPPTEDRVAWLNVEKRLYQAIEGQVVRAGFTLRHLTVQPDRDYGGARAQVGAVRQNAKERLLGGGRPARTWLRIDHLGDGVWYAGSVEAPRGFLPLPQGKWEELPLEFLVAAGEPVPPRDRQTWLRKGRDSRSKW